MIRKNLFTILIALLILYLSLADSDTFDKVPLFNIPYYDKIVHFGMYFTLMAAIIIENRKSFKNNGQLFLIALIPAFYGVLMEIFQLSITNSRSANVFDAIANLAGAFFAVIIWLLIKSFTRDKAI